MNNDPYGNNDPEWLRHMAMTRPGQGNVMGSQHKRPIDQLNPLVMENAIMRDMHERMPEGQSSELFSMGLMGSPARTEALGSDQLSQKLIGLGIMPGSKEMDEAYKMISEKNIDGLIDVIQRSTGLNASGIKGGFNRSEAGLLGQ